MLARDHAHVGRVIGVEANAISYCVQREGHLCRRRHRGHLSRSGRAALVAVLQAADFGQLDYLAHARRLEGAITLA